MKRALTIAVLLALGLAPLRADFDPRTPSSAKFVKATTLGTTSGVVTSVTFGSSDTTLWRVNVTHSTSVNTDRLTIVAPGKYLVIGYVSFANNILGQRQVILTQQDVNNNVIDLGGRQQATCVSTEITTLCTSQVFNCAVGDYITMSVFQNSTSSVNLAVGSSLSVSIFPGQ